MVETARLVCIARKAGMEALRNYTVYKEGNGGSELLEEAEYGSFNIITEKLDHFFHEIPVVSRIKKNNGNSADRYFLVDPLSDSSAFISKKDSFTVNITYIENGKPKCGVVHAPALNDSYFADDRGGFVYDRYTQTSRLFGSASDTEAGADSLTNKLLQYIQNDAGRSSSSGDDLPKVICD